MCVYMHMSPHHQYVYIYFEVSNTLDRDSTLVEKEK